MIRKILLTVMLLFFAKINLLAQAQGNDLLKKLDNMNSKIKDKSSNMEMIMVNLKTNKEKIKKGEIIQKDGNKKLFRYTYPKSDVGIATLSLPNGEIYLYLPLFKKPKKITNLADNKMNKSDFSTDDMAITIYDELYDAEVKEIQSEVYVLDLKSKNGDLDYNHLIVQLNKKEFYPERIEYYDKKEKLEKISTSTYIKIDGLWVAEKVSMENKKKNHRTTILMTDIKINQGLKDDEFTLEKLSPKTTE